MVELILRRIDGFIGHYISNLGFVIISEKKRCVRHFYSKKYGYTSVIIKQPIMNSRGNNQPTRHYVHRLVCMYFLENPDPTKYHIIRHIDGDRTNNNVNNLEWIRYQDLKPNDIYDVITDRVFCSTVDSDFGEGPERNKILEKYINEALEKDLTLQKGRNNNWVSSFNKYQEKRENKIFQNLRCNEVLRSLYKINLFNLIDLVTLDLGNQDMVGHPIHHIQH